MVEWFHCLSIRMSYSFNAGDAPNPYEADMADIMAKSIRDSIDREILDVLRKEYREIQKHNARVLVSAIGRIKDAL